MENELIKLDFLKLDLLNSDRGYSTDTRWSILSHPPTTIQLIQKMPQAQVYQVQPNQGTSLKSILIEKIQLKKEKTSQGMCDKINRQVQFFLWMGTVKVL